MHKTVRERSIPTIVVRGNIFFSICQFNVPSYFDIIVKSTGMNCTKKKYYKHHTLHRRTRCSRVSELARLCGLFVHYNHALCEPVSSKEENFCKELMYC